MKRTTPLFIAFVTVAIDLLGFGIMIPLLPRYAERFQGIIPTQWQGTVIGLLMCSFSLVQFLFAPVWGKLSDRYGRRPIVLIGLSGSWISYCMFAYATHIESLWLLFVARAGQGLCGATISTAQAIVADCTAAEERAKGMALIGMAFGLGFTLGPILGALWVSDTLTGPPSAAPGIIAGLLSFLAWVLAYLFLKESLTSEQHRAGHSWSAWQGLRLVVRQPVLLFPLLTFFIAIFAFGLFEGTMSRMTQRVLHYTDRENFYVFFIIGLTLTLTQGFIVRKLSPKWGEIRMIQWGVASMLLGMAGMAGAVFEQSTAIIYLSLELIVVGFAFMTPNVQALISRRSDAHIQGEVLGIVQSIGAIARILGPFLGNVLYGSPATPKPALPYLISALLLGCSLAVAFRLHHGTPHRSLIMFKESGA